MNYYIKGIPDFKLRNQACIQSFKSDAELLAEFQKVKLNHNHQSSGSDTHFKSASNGRN